MRDNVVTAVRDGRINSMNVSYETIRSIGSFDHGIFERLERGRRILRNPFELDQYLYSYGPMTSRQWVPFLDGLPAFPEPTRLIDYGCGQGLGTVFVLDRLRESLGGSINSIVLIEPSVAALTRAESVVSCYDDRITVSTQNTFIDNIAIEDVQPDFGGSNLHVLSNVLDLEAFECYALFNKIFGHDGYHTVFAISHDRDFSGGSNRFEELSASVEKKKYRDWLIVIKNELNRFECHKGMKFISWMLSVEVDRGSL